MELLAMIIGYYLWGNDGFLTETHTACQTAQDQVKVCLDRGAEDARDRAVDEIEQVLGKL